MAVKAIKAIEVYPTCDIHLLLRGPGGKPTAYQLHVRSAHLEVTYDRATNRATKVEKTDITKTFTDAVSFASAAAGTSAIIPTVSNWSIAKVSPKGVITPVAVGETFCRIRYTDRNTPTAAFVSEILVRIRVHDQLDDIWIGNNQATLFEGDNSYVLTVYGHFSDGTIGDISSHPYLTFTSTDTSKVLVDNSDDMGRLEGRRNTNGAAVKVRVAYGTIMRDVDVYVGPTITTHRPILKPIHGGKGNVTGRRNILILAEGFTLAEKPLFERMAALLKKRLFSSSLHEPFNLLEKRFNVWTAFEPSGEEGAGVGSPVSKAGVNAGNSVSVAGEPLAALYKKPKTNTKTNNNYSLQELIAHVGFPDSYFPNIPTNKTEALNAWKRIPAANLNRTKVEDSILTEWLKLREYHLLQNKDSYFGFMNGLRYGDRDSVSNPPAQGNDMEWYLAPAPPHSLCWDRRRLPKLWNIKDLYLDKYLDSLFEAPTNNTGSGPLSEELRDALTDRWISGVDKDLVVFLVNTAYDGGAESKDLGVRISTRQDTSYSLLKVNGRVADHDLPKLVASKSKPQVKGTSIESMTFVLAHELGHAFNLGDEYGGDDYAGTHAALDKNDMDTINVINKCTNLTHHFLIQNPLGSPGPIYVTRVSWYCWKRVKRASVLTQTATPNNGRLPIRIPRADRIKWYEAKKRNRDVYLRPRNINRDPPPQPGQACPDKGPFKINSLASDGTMVLSGTGLAGFQKGDVVYLPVLDGGQKLTVFHPAVLSHLVRTGMFFTGLEPPKDINDPTFHPRPRIMTLMIGVYEGGGTYNRNVYRPAGSCNMRLNEIWVLAYKKKHERAFKRQIAPFCYVCKYALANELDPGVLEKLTYPR